MRQVRKLQDKKEMRRIQDEIHKMNNKINHSRAPLYSEHYEREILHKREPFFFILMRTKITL